jgi:uncharacterized membrane protein YdjX (TVP38/TMEM64 family)
MLKAPTPAARSSWTGVPEPTRAVSRRGRLAPGWRLALLGLLVVALATASVLVSLSPSTLEDEIEGLGVWAALAYLVIGGPADRFLCSTSGGRRHQRRRFRPHRGVPDRPAGGDPWRWRQFEISRRLGGPAVDDLATERLGALRQRIAARGFAAILLARLTPIPSALISYTAGLTLIRLPAFVAASVLGLAPETMAYAVLGRSLAGFGSWIVVGSLCLAITALLLGLFGASRPKRKRPAASG